MRRQRRAPAVERAAVTATATTAAPADGDPCDQRAEVAAALAALDAEQLADRLTHLEARHLVKLYDVAGSDGFAELLARLDDADRSVAIHLRLIDALTDDAIRRATTRAAQDPPSSGARKRCRRDYAWIDHRPRRDERSMVLARARLKARRSLGRVADERAAAAACANLTRAYAAEQASRTLTTAVLGELLDALAAAAHLDYLERESRPPPGDALPAVLVGSLAAAPGAPSRYSCRAAVAGPAGPTPPDR